jgi:virginiamycin B lyase
VTEFRLEDGATPAGLASGPPNTIWATEEGENAISRVNATSGNEIGDIPIPTPSAKPNGIVRDLEGNFWFCEREGNKIGKVAGTTLTELAVPTPAASPRGIALGPDGNIWFTENGSNKIGRVNVTPPSCGTGRDRVQTLAPASDLPCVSSRP